MWEAGKRISKKYREPAQVGRRAMRARGRIRNHASVPQASLTSWTLARTSGGWSPSLLFPDLIEVVRRGEHFTGLAAVGRADQSLVLHDVKQAGGSSATASGTE